MATSKTEVKRGSVIFSRYPMAVTPRLKCLGSSLSAQTLVVHEVAANTKPARTPPEVRTDGSGVCERPRVVGQELTGSLGYPFRGPTNIPADEAAVTRSGAGLNIQPHFHSRAAVAILSVICAQQLTTGSRDPRTARSWLPCRISIYRKHCKVLDAWLGYGTSAQHLHRTHSPQRTCD